MPETKNQEKKNRGRNCQQYTKPNPSRGKNLENSSTDSSSEAHSAARLGGIRILVCHRSSQKKLSDWIKGGGGGVVD
jgi:hypothetical protein